MHTQCFHCDEKLSESLYSSTADLEKAEEKYEEAKKELESTLAELQEI